MIRLAEKTDLPEILKIYEHARAFMEQTGNPNQWGKHNPPEFTLWDDIEKHQLYVCEEAGELYGVFALIEGEDATYLVIEQGEWMSDAPYATIHRIASGGTKRGVFKECVDFCKSRHSHLRIDTHKDNQVMQQCIEKAGFKRCGIIYLANKSPRIAYEYLV